MSETEEFEIDNHLEVRTCRVCGIDYTVDYATISSEYLRHPTDFSSGCATHCLACWLGVGPNDVLAD